MMGTCSSFATSIKKATSRTSAPASGIFDEQFVLDVNDQEK